MLHASRSTGAVKQPRAVCRKCFMFQLDRDRSRRSLRSCVVRSYDRHLLYGSASAIPWLNFTDTQQVQAERFSFRVRVCLSVCPASRHESGPSLFLSTGKHPVGGQLPRVFFLRSAWAEQRPSKPTTPQKAFDFSVSFRQYSESNLRSMQWTREAKNRSFNVQTVK